MNPEFGELKWVDGVVYEWHGSHGWTATGVADLGLTNTPRRGEPEGSRDRRTFYDKADLLDEAKATVGGRGKSYGKPEDNFARIAGHWNAFFYNKFIEHAPIISPGDVAIMMALMKIARLENDPKHADSWVDLAGYAACGAEIETAK